MRSRVPFQASQPDPGAGRVPGAKWIHRDNHAGAFQCVHEMQDANLEACIPLVAAISVLLVLLGFRSETVFQDCLAEHA